MQTQITVTESLQGKFGPQLKDKAGYLSFGKFYKGETAFPAGTVLDVELYITDKGTRYINEATNMGQEVVSAETPKTKKQVKTKVEMPVNEDAKWDKINRGKVKSLFTEALLGNPNVMTRTEDLEMLLSDNVQSQLDKLVESVF